LALLLFQTAQLDLPNVERNPHTSAADLAQGKQLYLGRCAGCHGPDGDGGKGANLAVAVLPRATTDQALYRVVRYGLPETEMPSTLLAPLEVWQVAAYVKSLGATGKDAVTGDAHRGAQLAASAKGGCLNCHTIGLSGGRMGPALTDIGVRRGSRHLRAKLLQPAESIPDTFRLATVTLRDGRKVSGVRLNEDPYSIQLRDFSDRMHSFWKQDLTDVKVERRTPMPSYQSKVSGSEIEDLIAYLISLRGE
jgi:putative heme-binding domain-containing protein